MTGMKAVVIGQGYVGLPVAMAAVAGGFDVTGIEVDERRAKALQAGESYVEDIPDERLQGAIDGGRYRVSTDFVDCAGFDFAVISVPTPLREGVPDLTYIESAAEALAPHVSPGSTVVLESTTYPGTTEELVGPILEEGSGLAAGADFHLGYSPERIDPGNRTYTLENTPKVVSGVDEASLSAHGVPSGRRVRYRGVDDRQNGGMADDPDAARPNDEDAWVARLRRVIFEPTPASDAPPSPEPVPDVPADVADEDEGAEEAAEPPPSGPDPRVEEFRGELREVRDVLAELVRRTTTVERVARSEPSTSQALDQSIVDTVKAAMLRAQATGEGTTRLEAEVRVLEESVRKLTKQVNELNLAKTRDGETVAWTDVMLLAHELRSRVDDLDEQQRRALRDLGDWQTEVSDRIGALRDEVADEVLRRLATRD